MEQIMTGLVVGLTTSVVAAWVGAVVHRRHEGHLRSSAAFFRDRIAQLADGAPQRPALETLALECEGRIVARHVIRGRGRIYLWFGVPGFLLLTGVLAADRPFAWPAPVSWVVLGLLAVVFGGGVAVVAQATRNLHGRRHAVARSYVVAKVKVDEEERDSMTRQSFGKAFTRDTVLGSAMFAGAVSLGYLGGQNEAVSGGTGALLLVGILSGVSSAVVLVALLLPQVDWKELGPVPNVRPKARSRATSSRTFSPRSPSPSRRRPARTR